MQPFVIIMSNSPVKMWQQEKMWHPFVDQLVISVKENGYNGVKTDKNCHPSWNRVIIGTKDQFGKRSSTDHLPPCVFEADCSVHGV